MSDLIYLSNVRLSFPHLIEPQEFTDKKTGIKKTSYNGEAIMQLDHPGLAAFMKHFGEMALAKWKENANTVMNMIQTDKKSRCYGRGEEKINQKTFKMYDGYAGMAYISFSSAKDGVAKAPQIVKSDGTPVDPDNMITYKTEYLKETRRMYGGCRVNVVVKPWIQVAKDNYGNGIRCDLVAIQFAGDDTPFGDTPVDAAPMFGQVSQPASVASVAPLASAMPAPPFLGMPSFLS